MKNVQKQLKQILLLQLLLKSVFLFSFFFFSHQDGNLMYGSSAALHVGCLQGNKEYLFTFYHF